eukprot:2633732-Pyramimonas_sp.AAC.1
MASDRNEGGRLPSDLLVWTLNPGACAAAEAMPEWAKRDLQGEGHNQSIVSRMLFRGQEPASNVPSE